MHSCPEALLGTSCAKTHFIHCLGSRHQANIWSNATLLQPRVCFLNEIVNWERSESCYITPPFFKQYRCCLWLFQGMVKPHGNIIYTYQVSLFPFPHLFPILLVHGTTYVYFHLLGDICIFFLLILLVCIEYMSNFRCFCKCKWVSCLLWLCSMLVYHKYINANIAP